MKFQIVSKLLTKVSHGKTRVLTRVMKLEHKIKRECENSTSGSDLTKT